MIMISTILENSASENLCYPKITGICYNSKTNKMSSWRRKARNTATKIYSLEFLLKVCNKEDHQAIFKSLLHKDLEEYMKKEVKKRTETRYELVKLSKKKNIPMDVIMLICNNYFPKKI